MTIQFLNAFNGYRLGQIADLGNTEETRLIGLAIARAYTPGMDGESLPDVGVGRDGTLRNQATQAPVSGGGAEGAGTTNLSYTASPTQGVVTSDTGTDATLPAADGTNAGLMLPAQVTKLAGVATGATVNSSDVTLLARANHTGTQTAATISDFAAAADARVTANASVAKIPAQFGVPIAITGNTTLSAAAHDGAILHCSGSPVLTINTGLGARFSVDAIGAFTTAGTATVTDGRETGATGTLSCSLVPTATADTYVLIGSKV